MKVYDAQNLRNVALVGHSGSGKTQLLSTLLFDAGAVNRLGRVDDGTSVTDYDEEAIARKHTLASGLACAEWNKIKINFIDTPGMANFLSDARAALRVADAALVVVDAVAGAEVSTEKMWAAAEELGAAAADRPQPARSRARQPRSLGRVAAQRVRAHGDSDPAADRRGEGVPRASSISSSMKAWTYASDGSGKPTEARGPGRPGDRGAARARGAHRDGRRSRRRADGEVLRRRHAVAGGAGRRAEARRRGRAHLPGAVHVGDREHRHPAAARRHRRLRASRRASGRSPATNRGERGRRADRRRPTAARRRRSCGRRSPIRSPGASRCSASCRARSSRTRRSTTSRATTPERLGHLVAAAGQDADQRARDQGRRPRRGRQAERHADQRPARRQGLRRAGRADHVPRAGHLLRDRAEERAATRRRSAPRCIACRKRTRPSATRATRRPRSCCSPARGSRTSRSRSPS